MIVNTSINMQIRGVIVYVFCISVIFIYLFVRYVIFANKNINPKYKRIIGYSAVLALIVGFIIGRSVLWFSPRILVIEADKSHHYEYAVFDFKNDLGIRTKYLENRTNTILYAKKHVYTPGRPKDGETIDKPEIIMCPIHGMVRIGDLPSYIFKEAPSVMQIKGHVKQSIRWEINDH